MIMATGYEILWLFLIYSFIGWCLEVIMATLNRRRLVNRGFLNAPFCLLYGFSAIAIMFFLQDLENQFLFLFLGGMILCSFLEYVTGRSMKKLFRRKWWDYSEKRFNLDGYVCLQFSIFWGLGAVLEIQFLNPIFLKLIALLPHFAGKIALWVVYGVLAADLIGTCTALWELRHNINRLYQMEENLQNLSLRLGHAITRPIQHRMMHAYPNIDLQKLLEEKRRAVMEQKTAEIFVFGYGCSFYKLAVLFIIGSFMGDIAETIFCYFKSGILMSRSSLVYGPFSIVWDFGCVMLTLILYRYRESQDGIIFLAGTVLGGAYEYFCSALSEKVFGTVFWDYSEMAFNLGGRINLLYCFFWGIVAVLWLKGIYPFLSQWIEKIPVRMGKRICNVAIILMVFNIAVSALSLGRYTQRHMSGTDDLAETSAQSVSQIMFTENENWLTDLLDEYFPDERIEKVYPNLQIVQ